MSKRPFKELEEEREGHYTETKGGKVGGEEWGLWGFDGNGETV